ncbi:MAG TPA: hypothetical protein PLB89_02285 [Flavobacteriales bacterium]|nr:hypothetical protein [Flavobacteriales bacterium]
MPSNQAHLPERHQVIVTYLIIVFAFLMLAFGVWAYFDYRGLQLRLEDRPAQRSAITTEPIH